MKALKALLLLGWILVVGTVARGYVLAKLWGWFMVRQFGLPALPIAGALGVAVIVSMLTQHAKSEDKKTEKSSAEVAAVACVMTLAFPAIFLLEGWIVKQWLP